MELLALGVSHKTAPVAVRERLAFSDSEARRFLEELVHEDAQEAVVISTCNRTELYVVANDPVQAESAVLTAPRAVPGSARPSLRRSCTSRATATPPASCTASRADWSR